MRTEQRPKWSATAAFVHAATGSAPPWRALVKRYTENGIYPVCLHAHISLNRCVIWPDNQPAVDDLADAGVEMTEEEWNLRVAELNKHQVCICKLNPIKKKYSISVELKTR